MARANSSRKAQLAEYLERTAPPLLDEAAWVALKALLAPVSEDYLRRLLRESRLPMSPVVEGVRQDSLASLRRTLLALRGEYLASRAGGDTARQRVCRRLVIRAREHARFALRKAAVDAAARARREEMILWMTVWLENPEAFSSWLPLRCRAMGENGLQEGADASD